jgi:gliding motility-associated-like protein
LAWNTTPPPNTNCQYALTFGDGQNGNTPNITHVYDTTGTYTAVLTVTSPWGCTTSDTTVVLITAVPVLNPTVEASCGQVGSFSVTMTLDNYTYDSLTWNIPGVGAFNSSTFVHTFENPGDYIASLLIEGSNNCDYNFNVPFTILPSVTLDNLEIPNVVTPNGDQTNDALVLNNLFIDCTSFDIIILNRWGNVVYEMNNTSAPFSGKDQAGKDLESGVYYYKLTTNDNKVVSGHITVIR